MALSLSNSFDSRISNLFEVRTRAFVFDGERDGNLGFLEFRIGGESDSCLSLSLPIM